MRRAILLVIGWVATAALAATMIAVVLADAESGAAGGARTEDEVNKRLAGQTTSPGTTDPSTVAGSPSGTAAGVDGTPIVTRGGTLSVRCKQDQPQVVEHVAGIAKPDWQIENVSNGLGDSLAVAHGMPNRLVTVISKGLIRLFVPQRIVDPAALEDLLTSAADVQVRPYSADGKPMTMEALVVMSWCEDGKPKWVLSDR